MDATGLSFGLIVTAFLLGLRHGIDWDHIIAITDIAATTEDRKRGFWLGTLYVLGHASVIIALGLVAIALGATVPEWIDAFMGRVVGITLIVLGLLVIYTLIVEGNEFRARSRWMLLFATVRRLAARFRSTSVPVTHAHPHVAVTPGHHDGETPGDATAGGRIAAPVHTHEHTHLEDEIDEYGAPASIGIGMLHGIGAETPTQVVLFLAAANAGGFVAGLTLLLVFVAGLVTANTAITVSSAFGFAAATRRRKVQFALGAITAVMSIAIGVLFLFGQDAILPAFFAG